MKTDHQIELGKKLRPMGLLTGQNFSSKEILKVLVIHDNINGSARAFQVVSPDTESFENGQEFFVMGVIVEFRRAESTGMECNRMNFTGIGLNGKDSTKGII